METKSAQLRREGNEIYKSFLEDKKASLHIKQNKLLKCVKLYNNSVNTAINEYEQSSAIKNLALISYRLFLTYNEQSNRKLTLFYAFETQINYKKAFEVAIGKMSVFWSQIITENVQSNEWINQIKQKQIEAAESYLDLFIKWHITDDNERIDLLVHYRDISPDIVKCLVNYQISELCHRVSIKLLDFCFRYINECKFQK